MPPTEDNPAPSSPKETAISFLRLAATGKVREAYQKHV
jgi:hypothetical protein